MNLWLNRSEAGAAAYGTNVLGSAGGLNRTFVLLFLNRHLNRWPPEREGMEDRVDTDLEAL
jgi:hypothetical protein